MPVSYPDINGVRFDWSSVDIKIGGVLRPIGVKSIEYSHRLEPTKVRGNHAQPIGRTRGEYEAEGSITLFKAEAQLLRDALEALPPAGGGYMEKAFEIVVSYADTGQVTVTDTLVGCRIKSEADSHSQGADPLEESIELDVMCLKKNGKNPLTRMLPARAGF